MSEKTLNHNPKPCGLQLVLSASQNVGILFGVLRLNALKHYWSAGRALVLSDTRMSCSLNSLKGGYIGDYIGDYDRGYSGGY